jgi:hypothetical protein
LSATGPDATGWSPNQKRIKSKSKSKIKKRIKSKIKSKIKIRGEDTHGGSL